MTLRETSCRPAESVERFARNERLGDLSCELDGVGTVVGHGFQSPAVSVNPNLQLVHRQGHSKPVLQFLAPLTDSLLTSVKSEVRLRAENLELSTRVRTRRLRARVIKMLPLVQAARSSRHNSTGKTHNDRSTGPGKGIFDARRGILYRRRGEEITR
jgi:hypothetical protein